MSFLSWEAFLHKNNYYVIKVDDIYGVFMKVPGTDLSTLRTLAHFILSTTLWENGAETISYLPEAIYVVRSKVVCLQSLVL